MIFSALPSVTVLHDSLTTNKSAEIELLQPYWLGRTQIYISIYGIGFGYLTSMGRPRL